MRRLSRNGKPVISLKTGREVARIRVGNQPQRMRTGVVRSAFVG